MDLTIQIVCSINLCALEWLAIPILVTPEPYHILIKDVKIDNKKTD